MHDWSRRQLLRGSLAPRVLPTPVSPTPPGEATLAGQLLVRATFGANTEVRGELARVGPEEWLHGQLQPRNIPDTTAEYAAEHVAALGDRDRPGKRMIARALFSQRQLAWRTVHFLNNHFATFAGRTASISEEREDTLFFNRCFHRFEDLLIASATSPAMIDFLDSRSNVAGNPNENYARELMELHTLGVDGGYTENDVAELARVFTGWSRVEIGSNPVVRSKFVFEPSRHDSGPKTLSLGWSTPGYVGMDGMQEGLSALKFLAGHSRTTTRIVDKLCRYFVCDAPPAALVARVGLAFRSSHGHLGATLRTLFLDPDFVSVSAANPKTMDGFEFVVNLHRRFYKSGVDINQVYDRIAAMRSLPHEFPVPTGYPETSAAWQSPGHLLPRWQFVDDLAHDRVPGTELLWARMVPNLPSSGKLWVELLHSWVGTVPLRDSSRLVLARFMDERMSAYPGHPTLAQVLPDARALLSMMLQLPELQLH